VSPDAGISRTALKDARRPNGWLFGRKPVKTPDLMFSPFLTVNGYTLFILFLTPFIS
jgi:hypothetical protein